MALIKCRECGAQVSNEAKSCPQCGAKPAKSVGVLGVIGVLIVGGLIFTFTREAKYGAMDLTPPKDVAIPSVSIASTLPAPAKAAASAKPANPASGKELARLQAMPADKFCGNELRKVRSLKRKYPQPWYSGIITVASSHGVTLENLSSIEDGKVTLGMNGCAAIAAWGRPEHINRTTNALGTREQWVYPGYRSYLYFEDGTLTSVQH